MSKDIRPVATEADYEWALGEVEPYFDAPPVKGSADGDRFDILVALIEAYENRHWPVDLPDPVAVIASFMEEKGYTLSDLAGVLGSPSRASEVMKRRRPLNLRMIQELHRRWNIPADALIAPYHLEQYETRKLSA